MGFLMNYLTMRTWRNSLLRADPSADKIKKAQTTDKTKSKEKSSPTRRRLKNNNI
jgi:hypothetical protein